MAKSKLKLSIASVTAANTHAPPVVVSKHPLSKAYELLANQPDTLAGHSPEERSKIVVSAVLDENGKTKVISKVGDTVWNMWPYVKTPNTPDSRKRLDWSKIPKTYREACQNVVYRYWRSGRIGWKPPGISLLRQHINGLSTFCRYIDSLGLLSLASVQPLHIANYVHTQKSKGTTAALLALQFSALELLYLFRDQHDSGLRTRPWPESSAREMAGMVGELQKSRRNTALTPLIPTEVAQTLFLYTENILCRADQLLDERDRGERSAFKDKEITAIRNACFYLLGVLTGMRCSELSAIEIDAGRTEIKNGITFHWIASVEYKTGKGRVEYLMPALAGC